MRESWADAVCCRSYVINLITTLSVSAISSNGTVRGGGAYYLISRSLGPEFGGSIGLVFYLGFVFNTGMNAVGLIDCIINNFGLESGTVSRVVPESFVSCTNPGSSACSDRVVASIHIRDSCVGVLYHRVPFRIGNIFAGFEPFARGPARGHFLHPDIVAVCASF